MATRIEKLEILIDEERMAGTFLTPPNKVPGVLFVHGWGGSQERDLERARGIAGLGCVCLTFDLRGHMKNSPRQLSVTRDENLRDLVAAYDCLHRHPAIDTRAIAVVGTSYGAYLSTILTTLRPVQWLSLRVPSLYRDEQWDLPKRQLDRDDLAEYRSRFVASTENRALMACLQFRGDVLIVESENDHLVPHATIMSYRAAFQNAHSMTHRVIDHADHALTDKAAQDAYTAILVNWVTEMVVGARIGKGHRLSMPA